MIYVYAVVSRRAGGVSIGVNLNPNNACNWRCIYCQVPGLTRGAPPDVDLRRLDRELRSMLQSVSVPIAGSSARVIEDVAFSGNGESTLSPMFGPAVAIVRNALQDTRMSGSVRLRLITNGSRVMNPSVQTGLRDIAEERGEVWFKVDGGSIEAIQRTNDVRLSPSSVAHRLATCADLVPTWVQTCVFALDGAGPDERWLREYLEILDAAGVGRLKGVLLYGLARPPMQPEASRLTRLSTNQIDLLASSIRRIGLTVRVSP